mmetsp:Transcript_1335/g.1671  ORF Transcript_1335/g.1671 Transcript_1335/m.1671 type:complete len:187 (-) Transcript_1335:2633-3193(-)
MWCESKEEIKAKEKKRDEERRAKEEKERAERKAKEEKERAEKEKKQATIDADFKLIRDAEVRRCNAINGGTKVISGDCLNYCSRSSWDYCTYYHPGNDLPPHCMFGASCRYKESCRFNHLPRKPASLSSSQYGTSHGIRHYGFGYKQNCTCNDNDCSYDDSDDDYRDCGYGCDESDDEYDDYCYAY